MIFGWKESKVSRERKKDRIRGMNFFLNLKLYRITEPN